MSLCQKFLTLPIILISLCAYGQTEELDKQNKSTYTNANPYEIVKVNPAKGKKVKNVVLMIGDGMGLAQMSAAWVANHGKLNIDNFTSTGFSRTWCTNRLTTDSGAAGTAMATGNKTNYHAIAVDTTGKPLESLTDLAHNKGMKTGIVVTCNLTDATPSAFCANNSDRDKEEEIAADYLKCNVDYLFGAGREKFNHRSDQRDLLHEMKLNGYQVCSTWEETARITDGKVFSILKEGQLPLAGDRGDLLSRASMHAVTTLDQPSGKGLFAMIESSRIDDCGHDNNLKTLMEEVLDFDRCIGKVLQWAEKDGQTLVIVLSDHETGGFTLLDGDLKKGIVSGKFSTNGHSGILVPVYAYGPAADHFEGIYENTEIFQKIVSILKL